MDQWELKLQAITEKVEKLIAVNERLKRQLTDSERQLSLKNSAIVNLESEIRDQDKQLELLRTAQVIGGGNDDYKTETKRKITALVKEIDACIAQLT